MSAAPQPGPVDAARLYERHRQRLLSFCAGRLGSRDEAEDAVQTTFLYAVRGLQRGVVPEFELAWLLKIADNVCRARRRSAWWRRRVDLEHELESLHAPARAEGELIGLP